MIKTQCVHADDVADDYVRAALSDVRGPLNVASDPVLSPALVAERFGGRAVRVPTRLLSSAARMSWLAVAAHRAGLGDHGGGRAVGGLLLDPPRASSAGSRTMTR
jgi:hypothetical protein